MVMLLGNLDFGESLLELPSVAFLQCAMTSVIHQTGIASLGSLLLDIELKLLRGNLPASLALLVGKDDLDAWRQLAQLCLQLLPDLRVGQAPKLLPPELLAGSCQDFLRCKLVSDCFRLCVHKNFLRRHHCTLAILRGGLGGTLGNKTGENC